jgi:serine/threonine protein phosphatase PrpC
MKKAVAAGKEPIQVGCYPGTREYQEDDFGIWAKENRLLLVVADGMGGHSRGDLASRWLVEELVLTFKQEETIETILVGGIEKTMQRMQESGKDMGCTFATALIEKKNETYELSYTWVGDSRLYLATGKSVEKPSDNAQKIAEKEAYSFWMLTGDDTFAWTFYLNGELDIDEVTRHPNKNQLEFSIHPAQAEALNIVKKRLRTVHLNEGDKIFLCTDGVWETYISQADILEDLYSPGQGRMILNHLEKALEDNTMNDNATFILAEVKEDLFHQRFFDIEPFKGKKKRIGSIIMTIFILLIFMLIFLALIGELDPIIKAIKKKILEITHAKL